MTNYCGRLAILSGENAYTLIRSTFLETAMSKPFTIVMPLYQGITQLDFTGPYQFFSQLPDANVIVASLGAEPVNMGSFSFDSLSPLEEIADCDLLCMPGGNCTNAIENVDFLAAIRRLGLGASYLTSVCTGSLILAAAGLLNGKRAACHWAWRDSLALFGAIPDAGRVVKDGHVITGGGVTAGIDFALVVIAEIAGEEVAQSIQLGLEYAPEPPFTAGRPETAPPAVREKVMQRMQKAVQEKMPILEKAAQKYH